MRFQDLPNEIIHAIFLHLDSSILSQISEMVASKQQQRYSAIALYTMRVQTLLYQRAHLRPSTSKHQRSRGKGKGRKRFRYSLPTVSCV